MIVFAPNYPQDFLPRGAPRIGIVDDRRRRGWRLICKLMTEACGELVVIPRTVSDHFLHKRGLSEDLIAALRDGSDKTLTETHRVLLDEIRAAHLAEVTKRLATVRGVIFPGNEYDVPPSAYGEVDIHPKTCLSGPLDFRFETEALMAHYALRNGVPMLGICGGMQLLVALTGGKLVQHLPDVLKAKKNVHDSCLKGVSEKLLKWMECDYTEFLDDPYKPCPVDTNHPIVIADEDSILAQIALRQFGSFSVCENPVMGVFSIHHQGAFATHINTKEMKITALAPDGVVEAIEHVSHPFCIATQFHPEFDAKGIAMPLMQEMAARCRK